MEEIDNGEKVTVVWLEKFPALALILAVPATLELIVTSAIPDGLEYTEEELRTPRSVVKFTSALSTGVPLSVTSTLMLTASAALLCTSAVRNSTSSANADIENIKSIDDMYNSFFKIVHGNTSAHPFLPTVVEIDFLSIDSTMYTCHMYISTYIRYLL